MNDNSIRQKGSEKMKKSDTLKKTGFFIAAGITCVWMGLSALKPDTRFYWNAQRLTATQENLGVLGLEKIRRIDLSSFPANQTPTKVQLMDRRVLVYYRDAVSDGKFHHRVFVFGTDGKFQYGFEFQPVSYGTAGRVETALSNESDGVWVTSEKNWIPRGIEQYNQYGDVQSVIVLLPSGRIGYGVIEHENGQRAVQSLSDYEVKDCSKGRVAIGRKGVSQEIVLVDKQNPISEMEEGYARPIPDLK